MNAITLRSETELDGPKITMTEYKSKVKGKGDAEKKI